MIGFEDAPFGLPSFVRARPEPYQPTGYFGQFVFWHPDRTDDSVLDYALGRQHFVTTLTFGRAIQSNVFLAFVFGGICHARHLGPMERGFIDALAAKATYGRLPDLISPEDSASLCASCGMTDDDVRFGEHEARDYLTLARETQCPEMIEIMLEAVVMQEMERGSLSFFWTVCGAAYLGAFN